MTLDEAIQHSKEVSINKRRRFEDIYGQESVTEEERTEGIACLDCSEEHAQLASWLEELKARREADRWIPVSERLPKVSGYYLVTRTGNSGKGFVRRSFYDVSLKEWDESRVTAWRSLPEAYKESEGV